MNIFSTPRIDMESMSREKKRNKEERRGTEQRGKEKRREEKRKRGKVKRGEGRITGKRRMRCWKIPHRSILDLLYSAGQKVGIFC